MNREKIVKWFKLYKNRILTVIAIIMILTVSFLSGEKTDGKKSSFNSYAKNESVKSKDDDYFQSILNQSTESDEQHTVDEEGTQNNSEEESNSDIGNIENNHSEENNTDINQSGDTNKNKDNNQAEQNTERNNHIEGSNSSVENYNGNGGNQGEQNIAANHNGSDNQGTVTDKPDTSMEMPKQKATCTFSISCATILDNMNKLDKDKTGLVPKDGWILKPITVEVKENETVFDLLKRICMDKKIHMEASWTPMYNSAYIEGINNLYEFDCGSLSGWMYNINGVFYNYGCSKTVIQDGDVIRWEYTCDLGNDVKN